MGTSDDDALRELYGYPGWTPKRKRLAKATVGRGLGAAFDFTVAQWVGNRQSSSNSSARFVVSDGLGRASVDPGIWEVLELELLALLKRRRWRERVLNELDIFAGALIFFAALRYLLWEFVIPLLRALF